MDLYLRSDGVGIKNVETWEKKLLLDSVIPQNTLNNQGFSLLNWGEAFSGPQPSAPREAQVRHVRFTPTLKAPYWNTTYHDGF